MRQVNVTLESKDSSIFTDLGFLNMGFYDILVEGEAQFRVATKEELNAAFGVIMNNNGLSVLEAAKLYERFNGRLVDNISEIAKKAREISPDRVEGDRTELVMCECRTHYTIKDGDGSRASGRLHTFTDVFRDVLDLSFAEKMRRQTLVYLLKQALNRDLPIERDRRRQPSGLEALLEIFFSR